MKEWIEIRARGSALRSDEAAYLLITAGSPGVEEQTEGIDAVVGRLLSISPDSEQPDSDQHDYGVLLNEPDKEVRLTGHLDPAEKGAGEISTRLQKLEEDLKRLGWSFDSALYKDLDWSKTWRHALKPVKVSSGGRSVIIRSKWSKRKSRPGEIELLIDPSMAFGTGHHATTKLCLKALLALFGRFSPKEHSLLDVGTGTGVLAIAAVKFGVKSALGVEIDPVSLKVARKTVRANGVKVALSGRPVEAHRGRYSIIVANILSGELTRLSPVLAKMLASDGVLLLSGILATEADMVVETYRELGLKFLKRYRSGEWVALEFIKEA